MHYQLFIDDTQQFDPACYRHGKKSVPKNPVFCQRALKTSQ